MYQNCWQTVVKRSTYSIFISWINNHVYADEASAEEWVNEVEMRQKRAVEGEADAQKEEKEIMKKH